jgi:hypothetical protein
VVDARDSAVIPDDELATRRLRNLGRSSKILRAHVDEQVVGIVFTRKVLGISNVTWLVRTDYRRTGVAKALLSELQSGSTLLVALCRNRASVQLAKSAGFFTVKGIALWVRMKI